MVGPPASSGYDGHPGLQWLGSCPEGRSWLASLGTLVGECARTWELDVGPPFADAFASLALPVTRADGTPAVLKVQFPDADSEHEAPALERWDGAGAVRLLAWDAGRRALLLERCEPGTSLADAAAGGDTDGALAVLVGLARRLLVPAGAPFRGAAELAPGWAVAVRRGWERCGRPFERRLVEAAESFLADLPRSGHDTVLVDQDLHAGNVLSARRQPWLVIDPKPVAAEPALAAASVVRGAELGHGPEPVRRRLDAVVAELGLDRERARAWTVAHTLAWAFGAEGVLPGHVEVARWLLDDGRRRR